MTGQKLKRICLIVVVGAVALWLLAAYCLPVLLPFLIGLVVARLAHPLARRLQDGLHFPRWAATFLCVGGIFAALAAAAWILMRTLLHRLGSMAQALPGLLASLSEPLARLEEQLLRLCSRIPGDVGPALQAWVSSLTRRGSMLGERLSELALNFMGGMVAGVPDVLLFTVTAVLSGFMLCARLPELRRYVRGKLPLRWRVQLRRFTRQMRSILSGWLRAELKLAGVTFAIVTAGLMVLRLPYALLLGAVTAAVDALPVLGSGAVLLPWGAVLLLQGNTRQGLGLVLLYASAALSRAALEPRLLGRQLGLPPLAALVALYAGFRLCGVAGMLLFPIGAIILRQGCTLVETALQSRPQT